MFTIEDMNGTKVRVTKIRATHDIGSRHPWTVLLKDLKAMLPGSMSSTDRVTITPTTDSKSTIWVRFYPTTPGMRKRHGYRRTVGGILGCAYFDLKNWRLLMAAVKAAKSV